MYLKCGCCQGNLVEREGHFGKFYGCQNYPDCTYTMKATKIKQWDVVSTEGDGDSYGMCNICTEEDYLNSKGLCSDCVIRLDKLKNE